MKLLQHEFMMLLDEIANAEKSGRSVTSIARVEADRSAHHHAAPTRARRVVSGRRKNLEGEFQDVLENIARERTEGVQDKEKRT